MLQLRLRLLPLLTATLWITLSPALDLRADRMTPELLWRLGRIQGVALSPDGDRLAWVERRYDLARNEGASEILWCDLSAGSEPRSLVSDLPSATDLAWDPEPGASRLWFVGRREKEESSQAWTVEVPGGRLRRVTDVDSGVDHLKVSPTGGHIACTTRVRLEPTIQDIWPDLDKAEARIYDDLMVRHWSRWHDGTYRHLLVAELRDDGSVGPAVDLLESLRCDCPVPPFAGSEHFAWAPDGSELALTAKLVADPERSTDTDIYLWRPSGPRRLRCITAGMDGYDVDPVYSPDGSHIAFHSMERPGFEADRNRICLYDRAGGRISEVTAGLDQTTHGCLWAPDSRSVFFVSEQRGTNQIFRLRLRYMEGDRLERVTSGRFNWGLRAVAPDGLSLLATRRSMIRPRELVTISLGDGKVREVTDTNGGIYERLELPEVRERWVRATDGAKVHNWVIYPPDFDPAKRWPLLVYCQGGPQGQIGQWFSYRWNFHLMAAQGYVVLAVNRRGLPGFGRAWNDQISGDWGGQAMRDILAATDSLRTEPWVDDRRIAAIGASYGGYTAYWLMGHHRGRFATMISHCGVFNLESMYGSTEELFFVDWDLGGPYWSSQALRRKYDRFSPHRFAGRWDTPILIIHGDKDFRVPVTQALEAFTAARVEGVPARFLYYPNEGHWVLGPQNGVLWHRVFFGWLERWCGGGGPTPEPGGDGSGGGPARNL